MLSVLLVNFRGELRSCLLPIRHAGGGRRGGGLPAQVPLHPEVNRKNYGDDGCCAEHQYRKQNLHHHRNLGYQNGGRAQAIFTLPKCAFTRTTRVLDHAGTASAFCTRLSVSRQKCSARARLRRNLHLNKSHFANYGKHKDCGIPEQTNSWRPPPQAARLWVCIFQASQCSVLSAP
jgi:hypothetical protein